jgi:hypothetical protein
MIGGMTDEQLAKIVSRRFGRDHDLPCKRPDVLACALWACQSVGKCQNIPDSKLINDELQEHADANQNQEPSP